jgi:hypothetical protein
MISPEEEMRLYYLLEDKLADLELSDLVGAWAGYLLGLGIHREMVGPLPEEEVYMSADPIAPAKSRLLIPWEVVDRILFVGLP